MKSCPQGGPQSGTVRFEKNIFFTLNYNISRFLNNMSKISSVFKNKELNNFRLDKNIYIENCLFPITATSKRAWFLHFFLHFLEKTENHQNKIFLNIKGLQNNIINILLFRITDNINLMFTTSSNFIILWPYIWKFTCHGHWAWGLARAWGRSGLYCL